MTPTFDETFEEYCQYNKCKNNFKKMNSKKKKKKLYSWTTLSVGRPLQISVSKLDNSYLFIY